MLLETRQLMSVLAFRSLTKFDSNLRALVFRPYEVRRQQAELGALMKDRRADER